MNVSIIEVKGQSQLLKEVIALGNRYKDVLGLLPYAAYEKYADEGNILAALTPQQECIGYLLYRIVKRQRKVAITHLCVAEEFRHNGIARKLVETLTERTKDWRGISLYCKRSYDSHSFWPRVGFIYHREKTGRGKEQEPLTHYWYDHNHRSLLTLVDEKTINSKSVQAVIDANIFVKIFENQDHALLADWLLDELALCVTPELYNEIGRDNKDERRRKMTQYADTFPKVSASKSDVDKFVEILSNYFPDPNSIQDESDIKQIAYTISSGSDFFVTKDEILVKRLRKVLYDEFGLSIVSDADLIIYLDELLNNAIYQPRRLAGSPIEISRVSIGESDLLSEIFHRQSDDKKFFFKKSLNTYLSYPNRYESFVVKINNHEPLAILVIGKTDLNVFDIPLFRVINGPLSPALESQLFFWVIERAVINDINLIKVTETYLPEGTKRGLEENSFLKTSQGWFKPVLNGVLSESQLRQNIEITNQANILPLSVRVLIDSELSSAVEKNDAEKWIKIEKVFWPMKIADARIKNFIVPIQPTWAIDLFDYDLGKQTLFGSDPTKIFRMDNVYYRSANIGLPEAPSRILWYVSKGSGRGSEAHYGIMAVRACSYVEETIVGTPKELFKQFSNLGVYKWENVFEAANNNLERKILAFRFSHTEVFKKPVSLAEYMTITHRNSAPISPQSISSAAFVEIYKRGTLDI